MNQLLHEEICSQMKIIENIHYFCRIGKKIPLSKRTFDFPLGNKQKYDQTNSRFIFDQKYLRNWIHQILYKDLKISVSKLYQIFNHKKFPKTIF